LTGETPFPPPLLSLFASPCLRSSAPSWAVPPFYRKEFSSPDLSTSSPADRPASPTDRQAPPNSCHSPADHVSDVINGTAGRGFPFLTDRFGSGCATTTRVSPSFALRAATRVIPLPRGLTSCRSLGIRNPPFKSISAAERSVVECAWRWVPLRPGPRLRPSKSSFGMPWGGFLGEPLLKSLSSTLAGTALVGLAWVGFREKAQTPDLNGGWRSRTFRSRAPPAPRSQRIRNLSGQWGKCP
jgi:hypothetical protein